MDLRVSDVESGASIRPDTRFNVGPVSKVVSATAAMVLVESGRLDLDRPVDACLAPWVLPSTGPATDGVTTRRLLSHTGEDHHPWGAAPTAG